MKKTIFAFFLIFLLSLTACSARSSAPDAQQTSEPQADTSSQVDISELPDGQCYRQTPYLNPIGISYPDGQCIWNGKVYSFSNAPAKLGVTDANGNSEALELPDAEYIYGVCENGDTLAVLAGAAPLFFAGTGDEQTGNGDHAIYLYDETGKLTGSIPLAECCTDAPYALDSDGTDYFLLFSDAVIRVGSDGTQLAKSGDMGGRLLQLACADNAVYVCVEGGRIYQTEKVVRLNAQTLEPEAELSCAGLDVQGMGTAADGTLLLISGEYLLRPDFAAGTMTAILHWADNANTSVNNYRSVLETETGFFAWNSDVEAACFYEKLPDGETLEDPTVITLFAGAGSYDIEIAAANFQKLYPQYRIDITASESDEQTELTLTELGVGKGYDLYLLYDFQWTQLDDAVFFEDLTWWMEADNSKPLERIRPSVLRQMQKNGGIYRLPLTYTILTYAADQKTRDLRHDSGYGNRFDGPYPEKEGTQLIPYCILVIEDDDDREFMTLLYIRYQRLLYKEIYEILKNSWNTEDILQATLVKLIDKIPELRQKERPQLVGYICAAARNTALNFLRAQDKIAPFSFEEYMMQSEPNEERRQMEEYMISKDEIDELVRRWPKLDDRSKMLLEGKYILGKIDEVLAEELSIKPASVRMALTRARQCAYQLLAEEQTPSRS